MSEGVLNVEEKWREVYLVALLNCGRLRGGILCLEEMPTSLPTKVTNATGLNSMASHVHTLYCEAKKVLSHE
jgi:hypothetical protein